MSSFSNIPADHTFPHQLQSLHHFIDSFGNGSHHQIHFHDQVVPRFDLEEDANNYYLYGDFPGSHVEDVSLSAHGEHSLVVEGSTPRHGLQAPSNDLALKREFTSLPDYDDTDLHDNDAYPAGVPEHQRESVESQPPSLPSRTEPSLEKTSANGHREAGSHTAHYGPGHPNPASFDARVEENKTHLHQHHHAPAANGRHTLLHERLTGHFCRTFRFPHDILEKGIAASMLDGVLTVVVPKKNPSKTGDRERRGRIFIHKGEHPGDAMGFASGAV